MTMTTQTLGFLQNLGPMEVIIILGVGLLLFGRRLPEVGRSLGKSIVEFKRGLNSVGEEADTAARSPKASSELPAKDARTVSRAESPEAHSA